MSLLAYSTRVLSIIKGAVRGRKLLAEVAKLRNLAKKISVAVAGGTRVLGLRSPSSYTCADTCAGSNIFRATLHPCSRFVEKRFGFQGLIERTRLGRRAGLAIMWAPSSSSSPSAASSASSPSVAIPVHMQHRYQQQQSPQHPTAPPTGAQQRPLVRRP